MKEIIIDCIIKNIENINYEQIEKLVEVPKNSTNGDYSFPTFFLAKTLQKNPNQISIELKEKILKNLPKEIDKIESTGPFLNFYLNKIYICKTSIDNVLNKSAFKIKNNNPKKILIEYPSPNTNKSLHIGHVRNMLLGNSINNLLKATGHKTIITTINNDKGIAICKAMLSYKLFANNKTPKDFNMKPDEFVEYWYVKFGKENKDSPQLELDIKAQEMLVDWEKGDKETITIWEKLMKWVFEGYKKTYKNFKVPKYDKEYFESQIYKEGKDIVLNAYKQKIPGFEKENDGAIFYNFQNETYGKKFLLRGDGTTLYMTQDLYLTSIREKEFHPDKIIHIVGEEQKYHFEVLFQLLDKLKLSNIENSYHLSYGYVYNKEGKKFSSREGNIIGADWLLENMIEKAKSNLKTKELTKNLDKKEIEKRAKIIGFSALAFSILKINPDSPIHFDMDKSLEFEGETGPYIQYTYARIKSIIRKAPKINFKNIIMENFTDDETKLASILLEYNNILKNAAEKYKPSLIGHYLLNLAQKFNEYYQTTPILKSDDIMLNSKLVLCHSIAETLKEGLKIYEIETLEEM